MTLPGLTAETELLPVDFIAPPVNPSPQGLYALVNWQSDPESRFLHGGVVVRGSSYNGRTQFGVWDADWCAVPPLNTTPRKEGERAEYLDPFLPMTVWGYDECDLTEPSRREVEDRAAQVLRIEEQPAVEREFAERLKFDAADLGAPINANDLQGAVAGLESALTETNTLGAIHASPHLAVYAAQAQILIRSGGGFVTPLGHRWVFGGGYADGLQSTLVATSLPIFGWRDEPQVRTSIDERNNTYVAVAERSVAIGYEAVIASAQIS